MLLVFLYPTSLSLLNSELICRSYGSFGFLAVVLRAGAVVPLGCYKRQYRSTAVVPPVTPQQYYRWPAWHHRLVLSLDGEIFSLSSVSQW